MSAQIISTHDIFDHISDHGSALLGLAELIEAVDPDRLPESFIDHMPPLLNIVATGVLRTAEIARLCTSQTREES